MSRQGIERQTLNDNTPSPHQNIPPLQHHPNTLRGGIDYEYEYDYDYDYKFPGPERSRRRVRCLDKSASIPDKWIMNYRIQLFQTHEGWAVSCPDLPGCHSQGINREEAIEEIKNAIRLWLEVEAEETGLTRMETAEVAV